MGFLEEEGQTTELEELFKSEDQSGPRVCVPWLEPSSE